MRPFLARLVPRLAGALRHLREAATVQPAPAPMPVRVEPASAALRRAVAAFGRREDGAVFIMFAFALPAVLFLGIATLNYGRTANAKLELQNLVDGATLYAAKSTASTDAALTTEGMKVINGGIATIDGGTLKTASFRKGSNDQIIGTADFEVPTRLASYLGKSSITVSATSEVKRSAANVEVGIALDITGSMQGQKLTDLKVAAKDLVDIIVKDNQTPYYSKVALVPYSNSVNVGSGYAAQMRGPISTNPATATSPGSTNYRFTNADGDSRTMAITTCVSERTGTNAYTDAAPSATAANTYVGRVYAGSSNPCPVATIVPMSTNKTTLKSTIDAYQASGSTAGQIGTAWAWYMIAPNFSSFWPAASRPAAYGTKDLIKSVIIMTDGAYNTAYCNGVIARNSGSGSGSDTDQINCNATNGSSASQAASLCTAIKAKGVVVYTVGFDLGNDTNAKNLLKNCATDDTKFHDAASGAALKDAFRAIGEDINKVRISK